MNRYGERFQRGKDATIRASEFGDYCFVGDDVFVTGSVLGNHCALEHRSLLLHSQMGDYSYLGMNTRADHLKIGKFCSISWNVSLGGGYDYHRLSTHHFWFVPALGLTQEGSGMEKSAFFQKPLLLGNDVWIGANTVVMRGVQVGDGAVIGGGAVVTHDVSPYEIWARCPARKIGQRFSDEIIVELMEIQWWNCETDRLFAC